MKFNKTVGIIAFGIICIAILINLLKEDIYETVGYKWDAISETVNEGMNQIVFLKDGKVVCYLYGYPENNGYGISFESNNDKGTNVLNIKDDLNFQVEKSKSVVYLKN
ncbi:hypothetical protein ACQKGI_19190 [Peribacillus muralis]|uniref:hypothetical protein n=1 Tax=Peribacillus muralis TaxID=264697 RepID=UPI0038262D12